MVSTSPDSAVSIAAMYSTGSPAACVAAVVPSAPRVTVSVVLASESIADELVAKIAERIPDRKSVV